MRRARVGIDVGGTFTDFVLSNGADGSLTYFKEPSVPSDPSLAVERGMAALLGRARLEPGDVELVVHGTTLGLNAIIQRRGAAMALVVSRGNRDVLEIARCRMPSSYDFSAPKEEPLVPRDLVFEIGARSAFDGTILARPPVEEIAELAETLKSRGVAAVAVMLLNAYVDPTLETEVADALASRLPGVLVSRSSQVWPEIREYERALVAGLNAYIHPLLERYYATLTRRMGELGVAAPLYITASNGGALSVDSARARPIDTVLSGPASGVVAAARIALLTGRQEIITFDMGGTSSDFAVSKGGEPEYTTRTDVGEFPLILPVVNVSSIGAGGGSIVRVDKHGVLKVGPESAGADPGPASYRRGGTEAAITDCYVAAGIIDPDAFLGGRMKLDRAAASGALERVAQRLGMTGEDRAAQAAEAALSVTTAKMATELFKGLAQRGLDPRGFALIPFGGAGPTHANLLAEEARLAAIIVPPGPGTFCALGAIMADVKRDYVRTVRRRLSDDGAPQALAATIAGLEREATDWVGSEGAIVEATQLSAEADMRYAGQAYELHVAIPAALGKTMAAREVGELFHQAHERLYGFRDVDSAIEVVTLRVRVVGRVPPIAIPELDKTATAVEPKGRRRVFHRGQWLDVPVFLRDRLVQGRGFAGPALVEQEDTTTWIIPGWHARVDAVGNLHVSRG